MSNGSYKKARQEAQGEVHSRLSSRFSRDSVGRWLGLSGRDNQTPSNLALVSEQANKRVAANGQPKDGFGSPWQIILNVFIFFIVSQALAVFIVEVVLGLIHPHANLSDALDQSAAAQFFYILFAEGLVILLVFFVLRRRKLSLASIGLGRRPAWQDLKRGLIGFAAFYGLLIVVTVIVTALVPSFNNNQTQNVGFNSISTNSDQLFAFAALVFLPPLGEETLVRGYLYSGLRARWRFVPAMLVTSLLFGLAHLQLGSGVAALYAAGLDTFVLSLVLVYLRESTGALYAGMLVHGLNNVIAFGVHFH